MDSDAPAFPENLVSGLFIAVEAMERRNVQYALIGGLAAGCRSRAGFTQDVDFVLQVPQLTLSSLLEDLASKGCEFELETAVRQWTEEHMTSLTFRQIQIDWLKPVSPDTNTLSTQRYKRSGWARRLELPPLKV